jgi:peptide/nickel transport system substrate-binding protein
MKRNVRLIMSVSLLLVVLFGLTGCRTATQTVEEPTTPAEEVMPTTSAPEEAPTQAEEPKVSEPIIIGEWLESATLNPYYQTGPEMPSWNVVEGLVGVSPEGTYVPQLITEIPTQENGLLSEDGTVITYKLLDGLKWSDGEPVTSTDIRFTWESILNPANSVARTLSHDLISSVETPDELTAIVTLKEPFVAYQGFFPALLPEHILGGLDSLDNAEYNRNAIGTGPYKVVEWVSGSHTEYTSNPFYREDGKPLTDTIIIKYVPSREAGLAQLVAGEIDVLVDVYVTELETLEQNPDIELSILETLTSERLFLNMSDPTDQSKPHPILSDINVRTALDYAIDRQSMIDGLLNGKVTPASCDLPRGAFGDPDIPSTPYNPDKAKQLLDEAGWIVGEDGIRVKDGIRLSLKISTSSGNTLRELEEQLMQEEFADVGVELIIDNKPSAVFWGSWSEGGPLFTGEYDILLYATGPGITGSFLDPHAHMRSYYHSSEIPTDANSHTGGNYMRFSSDVVDAALDQAGSALDVDTRRAAYSVAMREISKQKPVLFLYNRVQINAFRKDVKGWTPNPWLPLMPNWDAQNWYRD